MRSFINYIYIYLINALLGKSSVNAVQHATIEEKPVFSMNGVTQQWWNLCFLCNDATQQWRNLCFLCIDVTNNRQ
jgi:hypothetical protein